MGRTRAWCCALVLAASDAAAGGGGGALLLDGIDEHVTMGRAPGLNAAAFTLELWLRRVGFGRPATTGDGQIGGGVTAIPLITKGRVDGERDERDVDYFFGILPADGRLVADFEDRDTIFSGVNHSITATTPLDFNRWHHAALTYDGETLRIHLDGVLDGARRINLPPQWASLEHFGLGTALDSRGVAEGAFHGVIDEVRMWNVARTGEEIRAAMNESIDTAPGLRGSWHLEDVSGGVAIDASGFGHDGVIVGGRAAAGAPRDGPLPPEPAVLLAPAHEARVAGPSAELRFEVADQDSAVVDVAIYGRQEPDAAGEFTIVALPDSQSYLARRMGELFRRQTEWTIAHAGAMNLAAVAHLGDIVNTDHHPWEWDGAEVAIGILEAIPELPYALGVGNHDETPPGDPHGTENFNGRFPVTRYEGRRAWYGGHAGENNDNHYVLFTAQGEPYIMIALEYGVHTEPEVLRWADGVLKQYADRRAILVTHAMLNAGDPASRTSEGTVIFEALAENANLFLILSGHVWGEGRRVDVVQGHTIWSVMANFQQRVNGGNGWLRIMSFGPGYLRVRTFSPTLERWERDADSEFQIGPRAPPARLATVEGVPGGTTVTWTWEGLVEGRRYRWYVVTDDGTRAVTSIEQDFQVGPPPACPADQDGDGEVGFPDLLVLLAAWGPCPPGPECPGDVDGSDRVDFADALILLAAWGPCAE